MNRIQELCRAAQREYKRAAGASSDLPQEIEEGNVEYKLQLLDPAPDRVKHLTTQLHWRLNEGRGVAFYEIGVRDNGEAVGIPLPAMIKSLRTLARMCHVLRADLSVVHFRGGHERGLRAVRVQVTRTRDDKSDCKQLRVSVIGAFESGKSTLVGVLTRGYLDDGCGLARMQVFRHRHELERGCTSSLSEHSIGIASDGRFCMLVGDGDADCELRDQDDGEGSHDAGEDTPRALTSMLTFSDLAGHKKYFKVTAAGLASQFPDYVMLVIDAAKGVEPMTVEHIQIAVALEVAVFVVVTKMDTASSERVSRTIDEVSTLLESICPEKRIQCVDANTGSTRVDDREIPLLLVSSVTGTGVKNLQDYLTRLTPKRIWSTQSSTAAEFQINNAYDLDSTGTVVTGLVQSGTITVGESMLLGPDSTGAFCSVSVDSIEVQRRAVASLAAGETGALLISVSPPISLSALQGNGNVDGAVTRNLPAAQIRKGMMLIHPSVEPMATLQFDAEVHVLRDLPALKENYQAMVHAGGIRQMAKVVHIQVQAHSPRAICRFQFMYWPEYMRPDNPMVLRGGCAYAVGKVVRGVHFTATELPPRVRTH